MKRGIKWRAVHPPGIDHLDPDQRFMGFPLLHLRNVEGLIAEARGIFRWRKIVVGDRFFRSSGAEQQAVLLHEAGHLQRRHMERRILLIPFFWTRWARRIAAAHEMEADELPVRSGYGIHLLQHLGKHYVGDGEFYPPFGQRVQNIYRIINEVNHGKVAA